MNHYPASSKPSVITQSRWSRTGRLAASAVSAGGEAWLFGGYNGVPSEAEKSLFGYSFVTGDWKQLGDLPRGTMDHRGLLFSNGWYYLVGGMQNPQAVTADVYRFRVE